MEQKISDGHREQQYGIEQLRQRMDDADRQRQRAVELEAQSSEQALLLVRESQEKRLIELERILTQRINYSESELGVRIEAIKEAGDKLASERDRAASTLRDANQRALDQAEEERRKASERLAEQITQQISSGDENLRLHIHGQGEQLEASRRETQIVHEASEKAIAKAEFANEKRFAAVNGFRQQLSDQAKDFMPRELAESQVDELRKEVSLLRQGQTTSEGKSAGSAATLGYLVAGATLIISIVVVGVNILLATT